MFSLKNQKAIDKCVCLCYNIKAFNGRLAQLGEHLPYKQRVTGSSPVLSTIPADLAHLVERHLAKVEVAGSSPVIRSKTKTVPLWYGFYFGT